MDFFDRLKSKVCQSDNYQLLSNWLDKIIEQELPEEIIAFNFNLYEAIINYI